MINFKSPQHVKDEICRRWNNGESARIIGDAMHMTRNAVIGQIGRMRHAGVLWEGKPLRGEGSATVRFQKKVKQKKVKQKPIRHAPVPVARQLMVRRVDDLPRIVKAPMPRPKIKGQWVPLMETDEGTCRFEKDNLYCNAPIGPYCEEHRGRVYDLDYRHRVARRTHQFSLLSSTVE